MELQYGFEEWEQLLPPEKMQLEEQLYWADIEYMLSLLPGMLREIWVVCESFLDQYEYEGSAMYMQYPDQATMHRIAAQIYERVRYLETEEPKEGEKSPLYVMVMGVLLTNMAHRRQRYWRRKRVKYETINHGDQKLFG